MTPHSFGGTIQDLQTLDFAQKFSEDMRYSLYTLPFISPPPLQPITRCTFKW